MSCRLPGFCALSLVLSWASFGASAASAQTTYQQSTGLTWSAATLELGMALSTGAMAVSDPANAQGVGLITLGAAAIASGVSAGVAQGTDAPVEPAMVFHHGFLGGALLGGLLSFSVRAAGETGDLSTWLGVIGLLAGAGAMATYSVFRMERLAHDPQLVEEAHVLSWTPLLSAGILSVALTAAGFVEGAGVVGAIVGLVALGIGISLVEVAIAENPVPDTMMMGAPLVSF
ncbi:MAG: hypothetical protein AB8I08_16720 [Sandaracinaceae bacterium]